MRFDDDTIYNILNDPNTNIGTGSVFMFDPSSGSVNLVFIEPSLPPKFVKGGVTTTTAATIATATAAKFYYDSVFMLFIALIVLFNQN